MSPPDFGPFLPLLVALSLLVPAEVIAGFLREIRFSARSLMRAPVWTAGLVVTIALGIGSTAVVDGFARGLGSADGMAAIARLLRLSAIAVFAIACANVASFLLARATARARETAVRVAVGAGRSQLMRQALADSLLIAAAGAAFGAWFAWWSRRALPAMLFDQDADKMVFAADPIGLALIIVACMVITIACGLLPLLETRHDDPGAIMQRENSGPSRRSIRLGTGLVVVQMAACTLLVISAGLLLAGFRSSLQTPAGRRLSSPVVASVDALQQTSKSSEMASGINYFADVERAARDVTGGTSLTWMHTIPGDRPLWTPFEAELPGVPMRAIELARVRFTSRTVEHIVLPPVAGRLFSAVDAGACGGIVLSREAARRIGADSVIGRSIRLPYGEWADVVGVVVPKDDPAAARVYHYTEVEDAIAEYRIPELTGSRRIDLDVNIVSPTYFDFMGLRLLAGHTFDEGRDACRVAVVNQEAADQLFNGDAVGGAIIDRLGRRTSIIGVVESARLRLQQRVSPPAVFFPLGQDFVPRMSMIIETDGVTEVTLDRVHRRIAAVPGGREERIIVKTLDEHLSRTAFAPERIATVLVTALAAIALALGGLALYGVMNDAARRRQREFALRIALGAQGGHVFTQVLGEGARLVAAGSLAGIVGSLIVARWIATITPPGASVSILTWLLAPLCLAIAVLLASVLPARKALSSDPLMIMRAE
jgi:hypothetical protein